MWLVRSGLGSGDMAMLGSTSFELYHLSSFFLGGPKVFPLNNNNTITKKNRHRCPSPSLPVPSARQEAKPWNCLYFLLGGSLIGARRLYFNLLWAMRKEEVTTKVIMNTVFCLIRSAIPPPRLFLSQDAHSKLLLLFFFGGGERLSVAY